jgi:hypothetical protein
MRARARARQFLSSVESFIPHSKNNQWQQMAANDKEMASTINYNELSGRNAQFRTKTLHDKTHENIMPTLLFITKYIYHTVVK